MRSGVIKAFAQLLWKLRAQIGKVPAQRRPRILGLAEDQVCQLGTRARARKDNPDKQSHRFGTQLQRCGNKVKTDGGRAEQA